MNVGTFLINCAILVGGAVSALEEIRQRDNEYEDGIEDIHGLDLQFAEREGNTEYGYYL